MNAMLAPATMVGTNANPLRWKILATMVAAQFMFVVDAFIVNVAIPAIRADIGATSSESAAVIAIYQIAYASIVITGGRLGDIFGARRLFFIGLSGFIASSLWCGLSQSGAELIVARLAQGAAAALMVPQVLGTIHALFSDKEERSRAFGIFGVALGLGGAVGFALGGALVSVNLSGLGWRMIFFVNIPVGLAIMIAASRLMPRFAADASARVDWAGAGLLFIGLVALLGPVMFGRDAGWPSWVWAVLVIGALDLALFLALQRVRARRCGPTLIDVRLLADSAFRSGALATFCFFAGNVSFYFVMTLYMQNGLGIGALDAGLAFVPLAAAFTLASRGAAARVARYGVRALMQGCAIALAGLALTGVALMANVSAPAMLAVLLGVFGFGQGLVMAPLFATVLSMMPHKQASAGAGMLATVQQAGNATGVALVGALYFAFADAHSHRAALLVSLAAIATALVAAIAGLAALRLGSR